MLSILPLGCYGSDLEEKKCISMRVSPSTIIDAGAILSNLALNELKSLQHLILTHSHYDHIKDLPTLADFMLSYEKRSLIIHTTPTIAAELRSNIFNNLIWPDFTALPTRQKPTILFDFFSFGHSFFIDGIEFLPIEVNHIVESTGFIIRKGDSSIAYSGDTYICDNFVDAVNAEKNLKAICYELSFPNALASIARDSKHMTAKDVESELTRIKPVVPVHLFHLKPSMLDQIREDVLSIDTDKPLHFMHQKQPIIIT